MKNSYKFFKNTDCEYFPCHKGAGENFNCLFCYCPFYLCKECPGKPHYIKSEDKEIKDCSNCLFPHRAENYDKIIEEIRKRT